MSKKEKLYSEILNAKNREELHGALFDHFDYLADMQKFKPVLAAIMKEAYDAKLEEDKLVVSFRGDRKLTASSPADLKKYKEWPKSFQEYAARHEHLSFPEEGWALYLGDAGSFEAEYLEDDESDLLDFTAAEDVLCPITDYSDWWLYHPGHKNRLKEPGVCFYSHEGGDVEKPSPYSAGTLFLVRVADILDLAVEIPDFSEEGRVVKKIRTWWEGLNKDWKTTLLNMADIEEGKKPGDKELIRIINLKEVYSHEDDHTLETLEPLRMLKNLEELMISRQKEITDLSPLEGLVSLEGLDLAGLSLSRIDALSSLKKLERLELENMPLEDLGPLSGLQKLERLNIPHTGVKDLSPLWGLKKLEELDISHTKVDTLEGIEKLNKLSDINLAGTAVVTLEPLKHLKELGVINLDKTGVADLSPLNKMRNIYILHCQDSGVSFHELLTFVADHLEDYTSDMGIDIYSDYLMNIETFVTELEKIDFEIDDLGEALGLWINDQILMALKAQKGGLVERILSALLKLLPLKQSHTLKQEIFSNGLVFLTGNTDETFNRQVIDNLLPKEITSSILAFNLACFYSVRKSKEKLLEYTRLSLKLGHEPNRFIEDNDFKDFRQDKDFIRLCETTQTPDPQNDLEGWWKSLDDNWRNTIAWEGGIETEEDLGKISQIRRIISHEASTLEPLRSLTGLTNLRTSYGKFTSIEPVKYLENLEILVIEGDDYLSKVKIKSIEPLKDLLKLKFLNITRQDVSDISPLKNLVNLESLILSGLPLTRIDAVAGLTKLKRLSLNNCPVESIEAVAACTALEDISMSGKKVNSLNALANLTNLKKIYMPYCSVTDLSPLKNCLLLENITVTNAPVESLEPLKDLPHLKSLSLGQTKVPEPEIKEFIENHPKCEVNFTFE